MKKNEIFRFLLDIIPYENKLLIRNFSRTTPRDYQCIADNGIPPRDSRTRYVVPASEFFLLLFYLGEKRNVISFSSEKYSRERTMSFRWLNYPNKCLNRIDVDVLTKKKKKKSFEMFIINMRTHTCLIIKTSGHILICVLLFLLSLIRLNRQMRSNRDLRHRSICTGVEFFFLLSFNLVWFNRSTNKKSCLCHQTIIRFLLVPPELTIQMSLARSSSQILLICTIVARPLALAKWKHNYRDLSNVKRIEINDFTYQLSVLLPVRFLMIEIEIELYSLQFVCRSICQI